MGHGFTEARGVCRRLAGGVLGSVSFSFGGNRILAVPSRFEAVHVNFSRTCLGVHLDVGRCGRPRRRPRLIALATRIINAKIVLCVLVEILGGDSIAARRRFACQGEVALEYL